MYINRFDILSAQSSIYVSFCAPYKMLVVEMHEKSGGRHQSFTVESEDIVRARVINELKVK